MTSIRACEYPTTDTAPCKKCNGSGTFTLNSFTGADGKHYEGYTRKCYGCDGRGTFAKPDLAAVLTAIQGRDKTKLRSARPKDARAYYVWRMARFHGGADVTMPIMAMTENDGDPYVGLLDKVADLVAKAVFGTKMAAAHRWAPLLIDGNHVAPAGQPDSAYPGGRIADSHKPLSEIAEML